MASSNFNSTVVSLFGGLDGFLSTKTVVGEAVTINDTILVPLVDVSFGMGAGSWGGQAKNSAAGGMNCKMAPSAVLVIHKGNVRMVPVENNPSVFTKLIDMIPDIMDRLTGQDPMDDQDVSEKVDTIIRDK